MKILLTEEQVAIPEGCDVSLNGKILTVSGKKGKDSMDLSRMLVTIDIEEREVFVRMWSVPKKHTKIVRTCASLINNMIIGCTQGFSYKLKAIYKHFPITIVMEENGKKAVIKNFLGSKCDRFVKMQGDAVARNSTEKDYFYIEGINLQDVSQSAANIAQMCTPRRKDLRVFLDGVFVVGRGKAEGETQA